MIAITLLFLIQFLFETAVDLLNLHRDRGKRTHAYLASRTHLGIAQYATLLALKLGFLWWGGFEWIDSIARATGENPIQRGLIFASILTLLPFSVQLTFSAYSTFGVETRFGFNRATVSTFLRDAALGLVLMATLGGSAFALVLWLMESAGENAWVWTWAALSLFQVTLSFLAPSILLPLFNRFVPLPEGALKSAILAYCSQQNFPLQKLFLMDGSKRSTKANAFFTGFGRLRRLVLFDTLIEKLTVEETVAVVAHEIGHFRLRHILWHLGSALFLSAVGLALAQKLIEWPKLYEAFGLSQPSLYAGLIGLSLLSGPLLRPFSVITKGISRKFEYDADRFSVQTYGDGPALGRGLEKLATDQLSQEDPHPLRVWLDYSHPPLKQRLQRLASSSMNRATS